MHPPAAREVNVTRPRREFLFPSAAMLTGLRTLCLAAAYTWLVPGVVQGQAKTTGSDAAKQTAKDYSGYKGQKIVVTKWDAKFRLPEGIVGTAELGNVYDVDHVNRDWLWVTDAGGWLTADNVVLFDDAEDFFTARVKKDPTPSAYFERGMVRLRMGKIDQALVDLDEAVAKGNAPQFLNGRGIAHLENGDAKKAIADHTAAIRLSPKLSAAYYNRGNARRVIGLLDKAISDYNLAIHLNPENGRAYINRGLCWNKKQEYERAKADFSKATKMNPKWPLAFNNRAEAENRLRQYDQALADCNHCLKLNPKMVWAMVNRGNALRGLGKVDDAIEQFDRALEVDEEFAPAYHNRGSAYAEKGAYVEAIRDYQKAIGLDENYAYPHNGWAWLLATCPDEDYRDHKQAIALAEKACRLNSFEWNHFGTLAAAYALKGDFDRAIKAQKRAIDMLPDSASEEEEEDCRKRLNLYESKTAFAESSVDPN